MKATERFYLCEHCGNLVGLIQGAGVPMECCGQPMKHLVANSTDASAEKHIPAVTIEGNTLKVHVGEVTHPMDLRSNRTWRTKNFFTAKSGS